MISRLRIRDSVFLKLLLVFVLAGAANVATLDAFYKHVMFDDTRRVHRAQNLAEYGKYLVSTLGYPPDPVRLQELAGRLHMKIRVEGPGVSLVSGPGVPELAAVDARIMPRLSDANVKVGKFGDYLAMVTRTPKARYLFLLESENQLEGHPSLMVGLVAMLLSILLLTYLSIRRILSPLRSLECGVREVAKGNLDFAIPLESRDELGRLVQSFNRMTGQVRRMIQAKERLLLDVSHEFRTPLTRIKVALELPGEEARASIQRSVRELETMISELLESARLNDSQGKLKLERIDLSHLVDDLVSGYESERPGVKLLPLSGPVMAEVDPARICTALRNILENAIKYSSHQERPVEVRLDRGDGRKVGIAIRDFGIGISREDQPLIFEPFYRVDQSRARARTGPGTTGGYGLGLSLCRNIVEAHRGGIRVESIPGKETLFYIELPC